MKNDIKILAGQITLADAAYVDFTEALKDGSVSPDEIQAALIEQRSYTETQATEFIKHWHVVSQKPDTDSGFSATLFKSTDPNAVQPYVFAIKGTEGLTDILSADISDIAVDGLALDQIVDLSNYWNQLATPKGQTFIGSELITLDIETRNLMWTKAGNPLMVNGNVITAEAYIESLYARDDIIIDNALLGNERVRTIQHVFPVSGDPDFSGLLDIPVAVDNVANVTGHSLGGHLAVAMTRLVSGLEAVTINGAGFATGMIPGIGGDAELNIRNLFSMLGGTSGFEKAKILNLHGDKMPDFITQNTSLGLTQQGGHEEIFIEQPEIWTSLFGHGADQMVESVSVFKLLASIDSSVASVESSVALAKFNPIFESASNQASDSLESVINTIGELLKVGATAATDDRESLYARLSVINKEIFVDAFSDSPQLKPHYQNLKIVDVASLTSSAELDTADGYAYRYALVHLSNFAITGDASLYTEKNKNGELNEEHFTKQYLDDRAELLALIMRRNTDDLNVNAIVPSANQRIYRDRITDTYLSTATTGMVYADRNYANTFFGVEGESYSMLGGPKDDHFYGGIIKAFNGRDDMPPMDFVRDSSCHFVGGAGDDYLEGGDSGDHLEGGDDDDVLYGGKGNDRLYGGDSSRGTERNSYILDGADTLEGGEGYDTYYVSMDDTIFDSDGDGRIVFVGAELGDGVKHRTRHNVYNFGDFDYELKDSTLIVSPNWNDRCHLTIKDYRNGDLGINLILSTDADDHMPWLMPDSCEFIPSADVATDDQVAKLASAMSGFDVEDSAFTDPNNLGITAYQEVIVNPELR